MDAGHRDRRRIEARRRCLYRGPAAKFEGHASAGETRRPVNIKPVDSPHVFLCDAEK
jgi:hypothetical protein